MTIIDPSMPADLDNVAEAISVAVSVKAEDCLELGETNPSDHQDATTVTEDATDSNSHKPAKSFLLLTGLVVAAVVATAASRSAVHVAGDIHSSPTSLRRSLLSQSRPPVMVGAYYYPWHGNDFHNGDGFLRQDLIPEQLPTLGRYDDTRPETIAQHLKWSEQANIGLWVTSWWGPGSREDTTTKDVILKHSELGNMKIALHYETTGRIRRNEDYDTKRVPSDIQHMCDNYFKSDNYYRIDGRPVIFIYISRFLDGLPGRKLEEAVALMRTAANKCGEKLYLVGDHVFRFAPSPSQTFLQFQYFDAVTNYDVYGSMRAVGTHALPAEVDAYYNEQMRWRNSAAAHGCGFVSVAAPGYNDRSVRLVAGHQALSRRLGSNDAPEGSLFEYALNRARDIVDESAGNLIMINSFNEWHEDTQIEPVPVTQTETSDPVELTNGVSYVGYGGLYLDILYNQTFGHIPPAFKSTRSYQSS